MNPTLEKYHYPASLVHEYEHWAVLIRPWQLTLGCVILVEKSQATAPGQLSPEVFVEFGRACRDTEAVLRSHFQNDKINYVALMMADPNVHFHAIPRYSSPRSFQGMEFTDAGWPKPPDMTFSQAMAADQLEALRRCLADLWPQ